MGISQGWLVGWLFGWWYSWLLYTLGSLLWSFPSFFYIAAFSCGTWDCSIANLGSRCEEKIPTDSLPDMDLEDLFHLELAALGRTTSKKSPLKPEEELAEDPMPENEPLTKPLPEWNLGDIMQNLGPFIIVWSRLFCCLDIPTNNNSCEC